MDDVLVDVEDDEGRDTDDDVCNKCVRRSRMLPFLLNGDETDTDDDAAADDDDDDDDDNKDPALTGGPRGRAAIGGGRGFFSRRCC